MSNSEAILQDLFSKVSSGLATFDEADLKKKRKKEKKKKKEKKHKKHEDKHEMIISEAATSKNYDNSNLENHNNDDIPSIEHFNSTDDGIYNIEPAVEIKATSLTDFLKKRRGDIEDTPLPLTKENEPSTFEPIPIETSHVLPKKMTFNLRKEPVGHKPKPPILKTTEEPTQERESIVTSGFVPRNLSKKIPAPSPLNTNVPSEKLKNVFEAPPKPDEPPPEPPKIFGPKSTHKTKAEMLDDARARIANQVNLDQMYQPPKLKKKYGVKYAAIQGHESDESDVSDDENTQLKRTTHPKTVISGSGPQTSNKASKKKKTMKFDLKFKSDGIKRQITHHEQKTKYGEEGEVIESDAEKSEIEVSGDEDAGKKSGDDTEGEIHSDDNVEILNDSELAQLKASALATLAKPKDYESRSEKKKKKDKKKERKKEKRRKRDRSDDSSYRSRSRRRSRSYSRSRSRSYDRKRQRSETPPMRRYGGRYMPGSKRVTDDDKKQWPWSKGSYEIKRREQREISPNTLAAIGVISKSKSERSPSHKSKRAKRARSKSASPTPRNVDGRIDKKKLLEIAKKNAAAMMQIGTMQQLRSMTADELAALKSGGRSLDELTAFCLKLVKKEKKKQCKEQGIEYSGSEVSSSDEELARDEDDNVRHPFKLQEKAKIVLNIPDGLNLPTKTPLERVQEEAQLRIAFPVSSGVQHKAKNVNDEWEPVMSSTTENYQAPIDRVPGNATKAPAINDLGVDAIIAAMGSRDVGMVKVGMPAKIGSRPPVPPPAPSETGVFNALPQNIQNAYAGIPNEFQSNVGLPNGMPQAPKAPEELVVQPPKAENISDIVAARLEAVKKLQQRPNDPEAIEMLRKAEDLMKAWAASKNLPGAYAPGSDPKQSAQYQQYLRRDQLATLNQPVNQGRGMQLLMKMGWKPGMGIGKNMDGSLEPLTLDIKQDRRGLVAVEELPASVAKPERGTFGGMIGRKHPITLLAELCTKRRWGPAQYACTDSGPTHMKRFLWKVVVNGVEYQPAVPARNKKEGKLQAAQVCLQSIGVLPKDPKFSAVIG